MADDSPQRADEPAVDAPLADAAPPAAAEPAGGAAAAALPAAAEPMDLTGLPSRDEAEALLYHEQQQAALCGVHAINTVLQGPYFTEFDLAHMAQELDLQERALLAEAGLDSVDFLEHLGGESANVRDDGMFSVQVLAKALEVWGLQAVPLTSPDAAAIRAEPLLGEAFVANLQEHWFTIRRIGDQYWNFNSLFSQPEALSSFHLSAFLATLQQQGYTIFWIRGTLPPVPHPDASAEARGGPGRWWTPAEARTAQRQGQEMKQQGFLQAAYKGVLGMASAAGTSMALRPAGSKRTWLQGGFGDASSEDGDDPALARALAESLREADAREGTLGGFVPGAGAADMDAELAAAIAASLAEHRGGGEGDREGGTAAAAAAGASGSGGGGDAVPLAVADDEDPELAAAIAASLAAHAPAQQQDQEQPAEAQQQQAAEQEPELPELGEEPAAGESGAVELALRLPDGRRVSRRFASWDTVGHVAAFAAAQGVSMARHRLAVGMRRTILEDLGQTLAAAGLEDRDLLQVVPAP